MFDPTIGRWTTPDPSGFEAADADLFRYVHNNPTNATDPSGLRLIFDTAIPHLSRP
jgi:RHS repeat-associated protein